MVTAKKCTKKRDARADLSVVLFNKPIFFYVFVAVADVVAKTP